MSHVNPAEGNAVVVRAEEAEQVGYTPQMVRLLADSSSTGGRLSAQRVTLAGGADGASPSGLSGAGLAALSRRVSWICLPPSPP